ncbi:MAG: tRNA uracil 4-sulfurtransferase ThiI [Planctomycetota bacterium]|nr:tRNA uracil 4-sulfurtransferase ThiI [Planctomycetota bacterium]
MRRVVLVHYAEIGLKRRNRTRFTRRLADRLRLALSSAGVAGQVGVDSSRLVVAPDDVADAERAMRAVLRVPGVADAAHALCVADNVEAIEAGALEQLTASPPGSFKVQVRRADKRFPLTSIDLARAVGGRCADVSGRPVDVHEPDVRLRVEVVTGSAYVSAGTRRGPGGLPVGSTARLLAFLSGGLDSPVAAWQMIRRGARMTGVHFHNRSFQGNAVLEKIEDLAGVLAWSAGGFPLIVVPFEACQRAIVGTVPASHRMIVYRRAMFRIAARLAYTERALGYVTGDSLGQVASQTAENLRTIHAVADLPVYMPLVGSDKVDITDLARRIGTYDISIRPHEDCCAYLAAPRPAVKSNVKELEELEAGLDWDALVDEALDKIKRRVIAPDPDVLR